MADAPDPVRLDAEQPTFSPPPLESIPDGPEDQVVPGLLVDTISPADSGNEQNSDRDLLRPSALVFGAAAWSKFYNTQDVLASDVPLRTIRLALRYGIRSFDTSPYYGMSEIVLGAALHALAPEHPRSSYQLMTKCGRYGPTAADFDYSPSAVRRSVARSLHRLHTDFLDVVYLHDVEFVAEAVAPRADGVHSGALGDEAAAYGLEKGMEGVARGPGDKRILEAVAALRELQAEGKIRRIGISGLQLPTLLRLALLVLHTPPYTPLDAVLSYSHLNLQNTSLLSFLPALAQQARIGQVLTASPLNMGLLTPAVPNWHPAPPPMRDAARTAVERCADVEGGLPVVAIAHAVRTAEGAVVPMPTVVGMSKPAEVHAAVRAWRDVREGRDVNALKEAADGAMKAFEEGGVKDWTWASGLRREENS